VHATRLLDVIGHLKKRLTMRNKPILILVLLVTLGLTQKLNSQTATVTPNKLNVFYKGVDNPITVVVENCPCKKVVIKTYTGQISGKGCHYNFMSTDSGVSNVKIYVGVLKRKGVKWIDEIDYRMKLVPDPTPTINDNEGGWIDKEQLLNAGGIIPKNDFGSFTYLVMSYSVEISRNDSVLFTSKNNMGSHFENDLIEFIKENATSNDELLFYNIIVRGKDGQKRKTNEMRFKIK
jgi:hypothetical protein